MLNPPVLRPAFHLFVLAVGALSLLLGLGGCSNELDFSSGPLSFDRDTVSFDTLFTTQQSPDERLIIYNRQGGALAVDSIRIGQGADSPFRLILNGVQAQSHGPLVLESGDSLLAFVRMAEEVQADRDITDELVFYMEGEKQVMPLFAHVMDAYLYANDTVFCGGQLPTDKPIVIDGYLYVEPNCTLTIPPGAELFFTARRDQNFNFFSQLLVGGTLVAVGQAGMPIRFENIRQGDRYAEQAGQWQGLRFLQTSRNSLIQHALIKNASIGIQVDSIALPGDQNPKLTLDKVEIRNMSNYGILGLGFSEAIQGSGLAVYAQNCLITNCGQASFGVIGGGNYELFHCTLANYGGQTGRSLPSLAYVNNFEDSLGVSTYAGQLIVRNSIIWGNEEEEVGFDLLPPNNPQVALLFQNNLVRSTLELPDGDDPQAANLLNTDPLFNAPFSRDFRLTETSPAIDAGRELAERPISQDLEGDPRLPPPPDLGALEYKPLEDTTQNDSL